MRQHPRHAAWGAIALALACPGSFAEGTSQAPAARARAAFTSADAGYRDYARGAFEAAVAHARQAVQLAPQRRDYWLLLGQALLADGQLAAATRAVEGAAAVPGDEPALLRLRGDVASARGQAAGNAFHRALALGDLDAAVARGRLAVAVAPSNGSYRLLLVHTLLRAQRDAEALEAASEAVAHRPEDPTALALRGYALQAWNRHDDARADMAQALRLAESDAGALRDLRLLAADLALGRGESAAVGELLQVLPAQDLQAASRREWAMQQLPFAAPTPFDVPLPALDCTAGAASSACRLRAGFLPALPGHEDAVAGFAAMEQKDGVAALQHARRATTASPGVGAWHVLRMHAAVAAGELHEAERAASTAFALQPAGQPRLLAQRAWIRRQLGDESGARADADGALASPALPAAARASLLISQGRREEARAHLASVSAVAQELRVHERLELAYLAVAAGDDDGAWRMFRSVDADQQLPATSLLDAGYAAMRAMADAEALSFFDRAVAEAQAGRIELGAQRIYEGRRTAAEVERTWGVLASITRRNGAGVEPGFGAVGPGGDERSTQAGVEGYWRPFGFRNGRYVEVFARGFGTLDAGPGTLTGGDSFQGGIGARWKPFTRHNLVFSGSRVFGPNVRDSWLAQVGYSLDLGTDIRLDRPSWPTTRIAAEAGRYFGEGRHDSYALASVTMGRSFIVGDGARNVVQPHVFLGAEHRSDDPSARTSAGAGIGATFRHAFREDAARGPRSYWELTVQYRFRLAGDDRMKGPYVSAVLAF